MSEFNSFELGDLIEFQRGFDLPKSQFVSGNVPVISSNGILGFHNEVKVKAPGITIGRSGTVGLPHFIREDFFPHNTALFIKDFKGNSPRYIFYLLKTLKLNEYKSGSGVPTMNRNHLHPIKVYGTKVKSTQQKIASVLSTIDDKIELNNRINDNLEQTAKTLYDYWFMQFDFPDDNGKPYKSSGGKMIWNEFLKREIPQGWEVKKLGKVLSTYLGGTPSTEKKEFWNGDIPWMNSGEVVNFPLLSTEQKITKEAITNSSTRFLPKGSVILSITRHLRVNILCIDACINQSIAGIKEDEKFKNPYIYFSICNDIDRLMTLRTGAQQPHINKQILDSSNFILPEDQVLQQYYLVAKPLIEKIFNNGLQNQQLSSLRDWLLPMLMNGQVKVE